MTKLALSEAVRFGSLDTVRALLDAGADIRYVQPKGYTVLVHAMFRRGNMLTDPEFIPILRLLIERGADLNAITEYGESALSVTSRNGHFDAVWTLLKAGANPDPLEWTALHLVVAIGTVAQVQEKIDEGYDLSDRDYWSRTPLLLSLQSRSVEKAELLLASGGSLADQGHRGKTPLMFPVENDDPSMLRWLLDRGIDPNATDEFGDTALIKASSGGAAECVRLLLEAGADPLMGGKTWSSIESAANFEIARMLAAAGADFTKISGRVRDEVTRRPTSESITCTPEEYRAAKYRVFGAANPQPMNFPFWRAMVACGQTAYHAKEHFENITTDDEPVWCFDRFGMSFTELPDGRVIEIGGEHEDHYDPDFCIYNDVVVNHGDGTFDVYGYPKDVFPPTDFHTATLIGRSILIIGSLGYAGERKYGTTPVFRLDTKTLAIETVATTGEAPGWISNHKAKREGSRVTISGGKVCGWADGKETYEDNSGIFVLDLETMTWSKNHLDGSYPLEPTPK